MTKQDIQQVLEKKSLRKQLYVRGFLFTDAEINENVYPFYGEWKIDHIHKYTLLYSPLQKCYRLDLDGKFYLLIGHAYDPFSMSDDENEILKGLSECNDHVDFFEKVNQLTGMFSIIWGGEIVSHFWGMHAAFRMYSILHIKDIFIFPPTLTL